MREDFGKFTMVLHNPSSVLRDDKIKTGGDVHPLQNQHREPSQPQQKEATQAKWAPYLCWGKLKRARERHQ